MIELISSKDRSDIAAPRLLPQLLLALAYLVCGKLGLMLALPPGYASPVFPAAGIAIAGVLIYGWSVLPFLYVAALLLNIWTSFLTAGQLTADGVLASFMIATGSLLQATVGGWTLDRVVHYPLSLDNGREILKYLLLIPVICLVSASFSVFALVELGVVPFSAFLVDFGSWWIGDTLGSVFMFPLVMILAGEPRALWRSRARSVGVPMLIIFALVLVAFLKTNRWENSESLSDFRQYSQQAANQIETKFEEQLFLLEQMASLFRLNETAPVSRDEFHRYVQNTLIRFPMIQAIEWAALVEQPDRERFETAQLEALPGFLIRERNEAQQLVWAGKRDLYAPVTYVEPLAGNEPAVGFDLASNPVRQAALKKSQETGAAVISAGVKLVQEKQQQIGALLMLAVDPQNPKIGVVLTVLRIGDFMDKILADRRSVHYASLIDLDADKPLYSSFPPGETSSLYQHDFEFASRHYRLVTAPTRAYYGQHRSWQSYGVLATGSLGTALLGAMLLLGTGYSARVEAQVSERTRALRRESEKNIALLRNASDGIYILDRTGAVIEVSQSFCALLGYERDEIIGMHASQWTADLDHAAINEFIATQLDRHESIELERRHRRKDGAIIDVEISCVALDLDDKRVLFSAARDISRRKRIEREIAESEQRLLNILNLSPIAVRIALRSDDRIVYFNPRFDEMFGKNHAEFEELKLNYKNQSDYQEILSEITRGRIVNNRLVELVVHGDTGLWALASYMPMKYRGEEAVLGWFYDITDLKQAEEALRVARYAQDRQRVALDLHATYSVTDAAGTIIEVNDRFCEVTGYPREELIGQNHALLKSGVHPPEFFKDMWETISHGKAWAGEICNRGKNGKLYWVTGTIVPFVNDAGMPYQYISVRTDITPLKEIERALLQSKAAADSANRAKSEFLARISHELRTPLNAILGFAQLMDGDASLSVDHQENVAQISKAGYHLLGLINEVLDLSSIESGKITLDVRSFAVSALIDDCLALIAPLAAQKNIAIERHLDEELHLMADYGRTKQVMVNLLSNALKYTDKGGRVALIAQAASDERVSLSVSDNGRGMDPTELSALFEPFSRFGDVHAAAGTGIGLSISKKLVERMEGEIQVRSDKGVGSVFSVLLPRHLSTMTRRDRTDAAAQDDGASARGISLLYIGDGFAQLTFVKQWVRQQQGQIRVERDVSNGIEQAMSERPDLILLDLTLPGGITGLEIKAIFDDLEQVRAVPVIGLYHGEEAAQAGAAKQAGFAACVSKLGEESELVYVIQSAIGVIRGGIGK